MAYLNLSEFNAELINCDITFTKPQKPGDKARTVVKLSYGPSRKALAFVTPACVVDWPRLEGDGNFGTKFGPTEIDKAAYTVGLTDKTLQSGENAPMKQYFEVLHAIDAKLIEFVHANQKELLNSRGLTLLEVGAKLSPAVKPRYEDDVLIYNRQNLSTRKFGYLGQERTLRIVDAARATVTIPVGHEDVCLVASQLDMVFMGLMGSLYGCKYSVAEVMLLKRAERVAQPGEDAFMGIEIPSWADAGSAFV